MGETGRHFVLVHGACHGAWCWFKVANKLTSAGHRVTALNLGASGINPKQVEDIHSISDYMEPLLSFIDTLPPEEKIIIVGHSISGVATGVAMEKFPQKISVAVYVSAYMPGPGLTMVDINRQELTLATMLVRPYPYYDDERSLEETKLTKINFGSVHRVYLIGGDDMGLPVTIQKWMIEKSPPEEVREINGADHMVMNSKPEELFLNLQEITEKYK